VSQSLYVEAAARLMRFIYDASVLLVEILR